MSELPRIEFNDLPASLAAALEPRVKRLGYFGEFFQCAAHQPEALHAFVEFTEASKNGLSNRFVEIIALTVAGLMGNVYERNQHERLSLRLGFEREWVQSVNALVPETAEKLSPSERSLQAFVIGALAQNGHGMRAQFADLVSQLGAQQAVAILMVIGRYVVHAIMVNTLQLVPPVPSIFEDGFAP